MNEQMTKGKILELTHSERAALQATLESVTPQQLTSPGVEGDWS